MTKNSQNFYPCKLNYHPYLLFSMLFYDNLHVFSSYCEKGNLHIYYLQNEFYHRVTIYFLFLWFE